jgi:hypothetical protein
MIAPWFRASQDSANAREARGMGTDGILLVDLPILAT